MARALHGLPHNHTTASIRTAVQILLVAAAVFAAISLVSFLCASRGHPRAKRDKKRRLETTSSSTLPPQSAAAATTDRKLVSTLSGISSKALVVAKMISWRKREDAEEEEGEEGVWRKTILMGEKCQPLSFSGKIEYDSQGNQVQGFPLEDDEAMESLHGGR